MKQDKSIFILTYIATKLINEKALYSSLSFFLF